MRPATAVWTSHAACTDRCYILSQSYYVIYIYVAARRDQLYVPSTTDIMYHTDLIRHTGKKSHNRVVDMLHRELARRGSYNDFCHTVLATLSTVHCRCVSGSYHSLAVMQVMHCRCVWLVLFTGYDDGTEHDYCYN